MSAPFGSRRKSTSEKLRETISEKVSQALADDLYTDEVVGILQGIINELGE